jgi:hypothetical protein
LTGYAYVANWLLGHVGPDVGISPRAYPVVDMMRSVGSRYLQDHADRFPAQFDDIIASAL